MFRNNRRPDAGINFRDQRDSGGFKKLTPSTDGLATRMFPKDIWFPRIGVGEIFRDAPSQDDAFNRYIGAMKKTGDRQALCTGADHISEYVSTVEERQQAIEQLTVLLGSSFADVTSSAARALKKLRATDSITSMEAALGAETNNHAKDSIGYDLSRLKGMPFQPTEPASFKTLVTGYVSELEKDGQGGDKTVIAIKKAHKIE
ncbi:MAG: hypothetical protein ABIG39_07555 [Candidatus Micrarchaeota archaeon]